MKTLEEYLSENLKKGIVDHSVKASADDEGEVGFYIVPEGHSVDDRSDFIVVDNYLVTLEELKVSKEVAAETHEIMERVCGKIKFNIKMKETVNGLASQKYTKVIEEEDYDFNAPHYFSVVEKGDETNVLSEVLFQKGPIGEYGVNGVTNEDLIVMCIRRLQGFQASEFNCRENAMAITKLEEALMWLGKRTRDREARGVEGTHTV